MISEEMSHYFDVLSKKYKINISQFIRQAVVEKLQRDMKEIRLKDKVNDECPF